MKCGGILLNSGRGLTSILFYKYVVLTAPSDFLGRCMNYKVLVTFDNDLG